MHNIPVITIRIEQMQHTLKAMLSEHAAALDEQTQIALEKALNPASIQRVLDEEVLNAVNRTLSEEVRSLFDYFGAGRVAIREAIKEYADRAYGDKGHTNE